MDISGSNRHLMLFSLFAVAALLITIPEQLMILLGMEEDEEEETLDESTIISTGISVMNKKRK